MGLLSELARTVASLAADVNLMKAAKVNIVIILLLYDCYDMLPDAHA